VIEIGYSLSSEELGPEQLVANAARAERAGFGYGMISDHFHPWLDEQGESPFVWATIGAISQATSTFELGTGVTCPLIRVHPAIVAQASATCAALMPNRFFLGLGTGENLNEHVLGDRWPSHDERLEMLEEALHVIRKLWSGSLVTHRGRHYTVDRARLYSLPDSAPTVAIAAAGPNAAALAGRLGDALVATAPDPDLVAAFNDAGGEGKPCYGQLTVCHAPTREEGVTTAFEHWRNGGLGGDMAQELGLPRFFRQATELLTPEDVAKRIVCGCDPDEHRAALEEYAEAGFDRVYVHQVGPHQKRFFEFYEREILPLAVGAA
jgi:G6PDH family F420-dependent oxidoreductase